MRCFSCDYESLKPRPLCPKCREPMGNAAAELAAAEADYAYDESRESPPRKGDWRSCSHRQCIQAELAGLDRGCQLEEWK